MDSWILGGSVPIGPGCCRMSASRKDPALNRRSQIMTRTNKVHTVKADPATLADANLSGAAAQLPDHLREALQAAKASQAQRQTRRTPTPRVKVTADEAQALEAMGWKAPFIDAAHTSKPQDRTRLNACQGSNVYDACAAVFCAGHTLTVPQLATLWEAEIGTTTTLQAIMQQIANRAGRVIQQQGNTIGAV